MTSDERREVAEKLRHASHTDANLDVTIAIAILETTGEVHRPIAAVVADLIDPTCRNMYERRMNGRTFSCSECGYETWTYDDSYCDPWEFSYCPNCGARVVKRGED